MLLSNQLVSKDDSKTQALPITWLCPPLHPQKPLACSWGKSMECSALEVSHESPEVVCRLHPRSIGQAQSRGLVEEGNV